MTLKRLGAISNLLASSIACPPLLIAGLSATGLCLNLFSGMPAQALTVTNSATFNPVLEVDGGYRDTGLAISGLGASVASVSLSLSLTKCGATINADGSCNVYSPPDFSFNEDIGLYLISPGGTISALVLPYPRSSLSGQDGGATVTWNFQDSFSSTVGGTTLVSGSYKPTDLFSSFNGQNPNGIWTLRYEDTTPLAPLSLNSWSISVTDETAPGPGPTPADVPGPLPLFGLAAAFGWSRVLRKRIRARRALRPSS
ncbi:proprotein convertase P-domain-containing protein [Cyanobium sp. BA20m-14]|nr:proprotein convertase P-domain-containing protein [Cyanobium sp. BA20m-14]